MTAAGLPSDVMPDLASVRSDALYRELVENIKDYAVFLLDAKGRVVTWNPGAQRIKGYTADEIVGRHFSVFYPEEERLRGKPERALKIAAERGRWEEDSWRVRKDGTRFWANVVITPLVEPDGTLRGFAKVTRDLSDWKLMEDERISLEAVTEEALAHLGVDDLLTALLDRISDALAVDTVAVLLLDESENVLVARASKGIEEEVEQGVRIPVGRGFAGKIALDARPVVLNDVDHADVLNPILRDKRIRSLMGVPLVVEGRVIGVVHVGSLSVREFGEKDVHFLQIVADRVALAIEHSRLYDEARRARADANTAEAAVRMRDEFLSVAAHELKTPMTSVKIAAQLLKRSLAGAELTPAQHRAIATVDRQITKLGRLVVQLLDTVRLQGGGLALQVEDVDIAALVREAVEEARGLSTNHEFAVEAPDSLRVRIDPLRIEQVLLNLLDNAVKFMPEGGQIDVKVSTSVTTVVLSVRDRGLGVSAEHRSRLFDRFYQAHPDRSGMGLGLYIARQIVERHGGTIYAESPAGGGTRFVISLPIGAQIVPLREASA
jgi:PAS domain S-box-containing protein